MGTVDQGDAAPGETHPRPTNDYAAGPSARTDVFLSHNSRDKPTIERIAERLQQAGIEPWLDSWNLTPGGRWQDEIVEGIRAAAACAVFVGPHGLGDWVREELALALDRAAKDRSFRLFVVLLPGVPEPFDPTTLPPFLSTRTWVDLRRGHDDPRSFQALINAVRGVALGPSARRLPDPSVCPYRGLEVFDADHAGFFFGREADIQRIVERLRGGRFLAVVGPSGVGKSSLVRAGVVPALRGGRLPSSDRWEIRIIRPGARPLVELAACLAQSDAHAGGMQATLDGLTTDPRTLDLACALHLTSLSPEARYVLVVDQFEEVFTLCADDDQRAAFVANLLYAARAPAGRCAVILTMRADFYPRCAAIPELALQVCHDQYLVSPLGVDGLREAIVEPAWRVGLEFEEGLVETILDDVEHQPGALPLLEHALLELWEQRAGTMLTLEAYTRIGGVAGALSRRADLVYERFSPEQQRFARRILLRLTQPGDGSEDTRRRCAMAELLPSDAATVDLEAVVQTLVDARLLTVAGDAAGERTVDVAHEALIRGWPRLRAWIDEDRAGLREHRRITEGALEWERLGRDESVLFRGARLATAREWRAAHEETLNPLERAFLDASNALAQREREAARRRTRRTIAALSVALAVTTTFAIVAVVQREWAQTSDRRAVAASRFAFAQELAGNALDVLPADPSLALRLAVEAVAIQDNRVSTAALRHVLLATPLYHIDGPETDFTGASALDPRGSLLALGAQGGVTALWDLETGTQAATLESGGAAVDDLAFSSNGEILATAGADTIRIWDVAKRDEIAAFPGSGAAHGLRFSADGTRLLALHPDGPRVWDVASGEALALAGGESVAYATFVGGDRYVVGASTDAVLSWDARTGALVARVADDGGDITSLIAIPNTSKIVVLSALSPLWAIDASTGRPIADAGMQRIVAHDGQISDDGGRAALAGQLGFSGIWDTREWSRISAAPGGSILTLRAAISADGRFAAVMAADGRVHVWKVDDPAESVTLLSPDWDIQRIAFNAERRLIAVSSLTGQILVFSYAALDASGDDLLELAERRGPRELTDTERAIYLHENEVE